MRPGVEVTISDQPPPVSAPVSTDTWFVTGITQMGPTSGPSLITSMRDYAAVFGARDATYPLLYDSLDCYFQEAGARAYVARTVGPAAAGATAVLGVVTIKASPGVWANTYTAQAAQDTSVPPKGQITIKDGTGAIVAQSPWVADASGFPAWGNTLPNFDCTTTGTTLPPAAAAVTFSGGADDRSNITATQRQAALDSFSDGLGPGQVSMPGQTDDPSHTALLNHADAHNRFAICDAPDTATVATLQSSALAMRTLGKVSRRGVLVAPWGQLAPLTIGGAVRAVPFGAALAGIIARNTTAAPAGQASAGTIFGSSFSIVSLNYDLSTVRDQLNTAGVLVARPVYDVICAYGLRTLTDPTSDSLWLQYPGVRIVMAVDAQANAIGERYVFRQLDGKGLAISQFGGELDAMLLGFFTDGSLYGETPGDAFKVDVGPAVNTPTTISNGELHAIIRMRTSPGAELVTIEIVKRSITQDLAA